MLKTRTIYNDEVARGWLPWGLLAPFLGFVFILISVLPVDIVLNHYGLLGKEGHFATATSLAIFLFVAFGIMGGIVCAWVCFVEKRSLASIGLVKTESTPILLKGELVGILSSGCVILAITLFGGYKTASYFPALSHLSDLFAIGILFVGFAIQSGVEEILFRGWLLSVVTRKFNLITGVILSSALFSLLHYETGSNWIANVNTLLFSVFACSWVVRSGNIWGVMGWHAGWNWFIGTGFEIPITGVSVDVQALIVKLVPIGEQWITGGNGGPENSIFCTVFFTIGIAYWLFKVRGEKDLTTQTS